MRPTDLRNLTWAEALTHVSDDMRRVHRAYRDCGSGTTRRLAELSGISLLTLRPRTTDLYQLGLVECIGKVGTEGIYEYRSEEQAEAAQAWREDRRSHKHKERRAVPVPEVVAAQPAFASERQKIAWCAAQLGHYASQRRRRAVPMGAVQLDLLSA